MIRQRRRRGRPHKVEIAIVLAVLISVILAPVSSNLITIKGVLAWEGLGSVLTAAGFLAALLTMAYGYRLAATPSSLSEKKKLTAIRLIQTLASIEKTALKVLQGRPQSTMHESHPLSLRQIRVAMLDLGIWTREDTIGFDIALRARNAIVHGDLQSVDTVDLGYAVEKAEQLLGKIRASNNAEDK